MIQVFARSIAGASKTEADSSLARIIPLAINAAASSPRWRYRTVPVAGLAATSHLVTGFVWSYGQPEPD